MTFTIPTIPLWNLYNKDSIPDGKFNMQFPAKPYRLETYPPFPGYIENKNCPFTFNNALTHHENGVRTNKFCATDDYKLFEKNLKVQPKDWKYRNKLIEYKANSHGYRTYEWNEIDWKNAIVIFGCSCTYGVGLAEDETISYYIEELTGRQTVNLGYPSGSNKLILDNCASMIKNFGMPYAVIINWTTLDRYRYYHEDGYIDIGPWTTKGEKYPKSSKFKIDLFDLWKKIVYNPTNLLATNYHLSAYADAIFASNKNYFKISFFDLSAHVTRSNRFFKIIDRSRDLVHPGEQHSIEIAEYIAERIRQNNE